MRKKIFCGLGCQPMLSRTEVCVLKKAIQDIFGNILKGKKINSGKHVE